MAGDEAKPKIKFPIRDTHLNKTLGILKTACILSLVAPLCLYLMHNLPKQLKYKNFYTNYDPTDAFNRMRSGGYLSSCPLEEEKSDDKNKNKKK